jgi:hypothetical protein
VITFDNRGVGASEVPHRTPTRSWRTIRWRSSGHGTRPGRPARILRGRLHRAGDRTRSTQTQDTPGSSSTTKVRPERARVPRDIEDSRTRYRRCLLMLQRRQPADLVAHHVRPTGNASLQARKCQPQCLTRIWENFLYEVQDGPTSGPYAPRPGRGHRIAPLALRDRVLPTRARRWRCTRHRRTRGSSIKNEASGGISGPGPGRPIHHRPGQAEQTSRRHRKRWSDRSARDKCCGDTGRPAPRRVVDGGRALAGQISVKHRLTVQVTGDDGPPVHPSPSK